MWWLIFGSCMAGVLLAGFWPAASPYVLLVFLGLLMLILCLCSAPLAGETKYPGGGN